MIYLSKGATLVKLSRNSITSYFSGKSLNIPDYKMKRGVFVTLNKNNNLRGCIGYIRPYEDIGKTVFNAARAAAFQDPRFPPVSQEELNEIIIEVSVLSPPKLLHDNEPEEILENINIGTHGLIIEYGNNSGLLLPQVFPEYNATPLIALEMTCQKAGLSIDAWKNPEAKIHTFSAQIFSEIKPNGKIMQKK